MYAPEDSDALVRPLTEANIGCCTGERHCCNDMGEMCPLYHVCDDRFLCPKFHFCGKVGRMKVRLWKKLERKKNGKKIMNDDICACCAKGECEKPIDVERAIAEIEAMDLKKSKTIKRKKRSKKAKKRKRKSAKSNNTSDCNNSNGTATTEEEDSCSSFRSSCTCTCHEIAASGRRAIVACLKAGMDLDAFDPLLPRRRLRRSLRYRQWTARWMRSRGVFSVRVPRSPSLDS